jgi:hypothetical protein
LFSQVRPLPPSPFPFCFRRYDSSPLPFLFLFSQVRPPFPPLCFCRYDSGVADISSGARLVAPESPLWRDPITGAVARSATIEVDRGVSFDAACEQLEQAQQAERAAAAATREADETGGAAGRGGWRRVAHG